MDLAEYYRQRAVEYEQIYSRPERQHDLRQLELLLKRDLSGRNILEIACGTGYWTARVNSIATSIVAFDINDEVLEIARAKPDLNPTVSFQKQDVYKLPRFPNQFTGALCGFWWSHVPRQSQSAFLAQFLPHFTNEAVLCFFDNLYVEGNSTPISCTDEYGNTYQTRPLRSGSNTEVLKNFYSSADLQNTFNQAGLNCDLTTLKYFWYARLTPR